MDIGGILARACEPSCFEPFFSAPAPASIYKAGERFGLLESFKLERKGPNSGLASCDTPAAAIAPKNSCALERK
eukprot:6200332-Pleurochrysis_carterae.AAC.1